MRDLIELIGIEFWKAMEATPFGHQHCPWANEARPWRVTFNPLEDWRDTVPCDLEVRGWYATETEAINALLTLEQHWAAEQVVLPVNLESVVMPRDALWRLLNAVVGPAHHIRELQATRGLPALVGVDENPIDVVVRAFNEQTVVPPKEPT